MADTKRETITEEQWQRAADAYERGTKHGVQIATELGVSPATVSREFKRRGCVKGSRVAEVLAPLEAELDAKARREAPRRRAEEAAAMKRLAAINTLVGDLVKSLIAAERGGNLACAAPRVTEVGRMLGVKGLR